MFVPVKLSISEEEHLKRITEPTRKERWKSIDPQDVYSVEKLLLIQHQNLMEIDVSALSAAFVANTILEHISTIKK